MSVSNVTSVKPTSRLVGAWLFAVMLVATASVGVFKSAPGSREATFADPAVSRSAPLGVYGDVLAIDPTRESMNVRLDVATGSGARGTRYYSPLHREIELRVSDGETEQEYRFQRDAVANSREITASLQGNIDFYPFDRYSTQLVTIARDLSRKDVPVAVPLRLTVWGGVPGWTVRATKLQPADENTGRALKFAIRRPALLVSFACVLYGIMVLIAAGAVIVGSLIFVGIRPVEPALIGALAAMLFALPALRNILPGASPMGVLADVVIVLWAELAVAVGLTLIVVAWARRGSQ